MSARVHHIIYLDAFVPASGQCIFDLQTPEGRARQLGSAVDQGGVVVVPPLSLERLGITDPADATWVSTRLRGHPLATFTQPVTFDESRRSAIRRTYISCTVGREASSRAAIAERIRGSAGWEYIELTSGHDSMITAPSELAALLNSCISSRLEERASAG